MARPEAAPYHHHGRAGRPRPAATARPEAAPYRYSRAQEAHGHIRPGASQVRVQAPAPVQTPSGFLLHPASGVTANPSFAPFARQATRLDGTRGTYLARLKGSARLVCQIRALCARRNLAELAARPHVSRSGEGECVYQMAATSAAVWGYGMGEKAVFLMRRISRESIFVKPKHLPPRSFSEAPMR